MYSSKHKDLIPHPFSHLPHLSSLQAVPRRKIALCCQHGESDLGITLFGGSRDRDGSLALYIGVLHAGSPADHHSGLVVGDRVVNINGEPVDNMSLEQAQVLLDECGEQQSQLVLEVVDDAAGFRPFAEEARRRRSSFHGPPMPPTGVRLVELPSLHEAGPDLGFVLTGCSANEPGPQPSGVFVASVVRGSVAEQLGLQVGDQLMEASGAEPDAWVSMRSSTYQAANAHIAAMRTLGSCSLVVAENLDGYVFFSEQTCGTKRRVTLQRDSLDHPLGFDVVGPPRLTAGPQHQGVFVVQVDPLSRAKERGIAVGDQVLDVNGTSLLRLPHDKARRVVLQACGEITLLLRSNMAGYRRAAHVVAYLDSRSQRGSVSENEDSRAGSQRRRSSAVGAAGKQQSPLAPRANAGGVGGGSKDTSASTDADGSKRSRARLRSSRRKNRQAQLVTYPPVPFTVRALYSFQGDAAAGQLSFNIYEVLVVTDVTEDADWWTAKALSGMPESGTGTGC